jgi:response regulator RpfG family c-di-GMP phosphodiesterase
LLLKQTVFYKVFASYLTAILFDMGGKYRILIIDDCKEIVDALKSYFERKYQILTAYNGFDGLQAFEQYENAIDLVIADLYMPELSGAGMMSILKKKVPQGPNHCNDWLE